MAAVEVSAEASAEARVEASVVVVTHDSREDIGACLEALRGQEGAPAFEVIVVDNGSTDGTAAFVRERHPEAQVIEQANVGFGGGNDRGVASARGAVVLFLNPDTVPEPGFVAALRAAVRPGQAATAQVVLKADPGRLNTAGHGLHFTGYGFVVGFQRPRRTGGPLQPTQGFSGAAFAMERADYLRVGGFDPDFFLYMEDTELSWRWQRAGHRVVVAPAAVVAHDYAFGVSPAKLGFLEEGRILLLRKHLAMHLWIAYAPSLVLAELMAWARAASLGRAGLGAKWRGLRRGWRGGIRRYPDLPRARPHRFASRAIPFGRLSASSMIRILGAVANLAFWLNTLLWPLRRGRIPT